MNHAFPVEIIAMFEQAINNAIAGNFGDFQIAVGTEGNQRFVRVVVFRDSLYQKLVDDLPKKPKLEIVCAGNLDKQ